MEKFLGRQRCKQIRTTRCLVWFRKSDTEERSSKKKKEKIYFVKNHGDILLLSIATKWINFFLFLQHFCPLSSSTLFVVKRQKQKQNKKNFADDNSGSFTLQDRRLRELKTWWWWLFLSLFGWRDIDVVVAQNLSNGSDLHILFHIDRQPRNVNT